MLEGRILRSRTNSGVFDGFDFTNWAELNLVNGFEGTNAVEVVPGPSNMKVMVWRPDRCGIGLENNIKQHIDDHVDQQGAMTAAARKEESA